MTSFCSPNDAGQCFPASHLVLKAIEDGNQGLPCSRISCNSSLKSRSTNELDESAHQKGPVMPSPQKSPTKSTEDTEGLSPGKLNEHPSKMASVQMTAMPVGFTPGPYDVLCGRGRLCKNAAGNHAYRKVVMQYLEAYAAASSKIAKGDIISKIVRDICSKCHAYHGSAVGGFIKSIGGVWFSVGEFLAREKTSQIFRDALSETYCSSAQSKYLRRRARSLKERSKQQPHTSGSEMKCSNLVPEGVSANLVCMRVLFKSEAQIHHSLCIPVTRHKSTIFRPMWSLTSFLSDRLFLNMF